MFPQGADPVQSARSLQVSTKLVRQQSHACSWAPARCAGSRSCCTARVTRRRCRSTGPSNRTRRGSRAPDETQSVEGLRLGRLAVAGILQFKRERVGRRSEAVGLRRFCLVAHLQVILKQAHALAGVVGKHLVEAFS
jgi:hypothetical protein